MDGNGDDDERFAVFRAALHCPSIFSKCDEAIATCSLHMRQRKNSIDEIIQSYNSSNGFIVDVFGTSPLLAISTGGRPIQILLGCAPFFPQALLSDPY